MTAAIFEGTRVKILKDRLNINDVFYIVCFDLDPTVTPFDAPKGSMFLNASLNFPSDAKAYKKMDNGSTTNWDPVITTTETQTLINKSLNAAILTSYIEFNNIATPVTPSAGSVRVYLNLSEGVMEQLDSTGLEIPLGLGTGTADIAADRFASRAILASEGSLDFSAIPALKRNLIQMNWSSPSLITGPAPAGGVGGAVAISPNGEYYAAATAITTPFIEIYQRSGASWTKLANPATLPTTLVNDIAFSPTGDFLACAHTITPFVTIYQRAGSVFTKVTNPLTLPASLSEGIAWSGNGEFLVVTHTAAPRFTIYQRSGTTFTKLADPATLPTDASRKASFTFDGRFLALANNASPRIHIYERSGTTFTKLAAHASLPSASGQSCAFSPNGEFLAVGSSLTPWIAIYQRAGTTFTKLSDPASLPGSSVPYISWSADSRYMVLGIASSPYFMIYERSGTTFTKLADPSSLPTGGAFGVAISHNSEFVIVGDQSSATLRIYQTSATMDASNVLTLNQIKRAGT